MEGLELDVGAFVSQQVHHQLEVFGLADVTRHHREVVSVQQQLAQELKRHLFWFRQTEHRFQLESTREAEANLQRLSLCDVVFGVQQLLVVSKHLQSNKTH